MRREDGSQEVGVHRMEAAAVGWVSGGGDDRLGDDESTEQIVAEPFRRVTDPCVATVAVGSDRQELEHLGERVAGIELLVRAIHRSIPQS